MPNFIEPSNQDTTFDPIELDPISHKISTLEQTLLSNNELVFFMQLYQLHTVEKLATRQCLGDHISNIMICRNLQHLDFSTLDYPSNEMQSHINVLGSLMIG